MVLVVVLGDRSAAWRLLSSGRLPFRERIADVLAGSQESNPPIECADIYHDRPRRRLLVVTTALARRGKLQTLPSQSDLFVLDYGPEAQQAYADRRERVRDLIAQQLAVGADVSVAPAGDDGEPPLARLPWLLEDLFFASWQARDPTVLTYTLYLLCQAGATAQPVRDYAIEVLRTFHQVLLPNARSAQLEGFIDKYGLFCWEILEPLGLVAIDDALDRGRAAEANYRMCAGPPLNVFVRLSPECQ